MFFHMGDEGELHIGLEDDERIDAVEQIIEAAVNSPDIDFIGMENGGAPVALGNSYAEYQFTALVGPDRRERLFGIGPMELSALMEKGELSVEAYESDDLQTATRYPHPSQFDYDPSYGNKEAYNWRSPDGKSFIRAVNHGDGTWSFQSNIDGIEQINYGESFEKAFTSNFEMQNGIEGGACMIENPVNGSAPYAEVNELKADVGEIKPPSQHLDATKQGAAAEPVHPVTLNPPMQDRGPIR